MEFFIRIENGQPVDHPIARENMIAAFPEVDLDNLPDTFAPFQKTEPPALGPYDALGGVEYTWDGNIVKEVHVVEQLSAAAKATKQAAIKESWAFSPGWTSWTFNEDTCAFEPPIPYPQDGKQYLWEEALLEWKEVGDI